jgi:hypothetical protein
MTELKTEVIGLTIESLFDQARPFSKERVDEVGFVLGGLAGLRTCELVRSEPTDPVLNWEDILWTKNLIHVRHEVAKQTRSRDHKRYVPLELEAAKILKPLAGKGPIISCCDNHPYIKRRELARDMKIKLPENCLRNSYATYALSNFTITGTRA